MKANNTEEVAKPSISSISSNLLPIVVNGCSSNNLATMMPYALVRPVYQQYGMSSNIRDVKLSPTNVFAMHSIHFFPPFSYH
jgi:hypothetical protein